MTQYKVNRDQAIDLIKIVAMCMVVCLHTTHPYLNHPVHYIEYILYNTSVMAVPLFFMVSGYLLIGRPEKDYRYSFKKIWKMLRFVFIIVAIWGVICLPWDKEFFSTLAGNISGALLCYYTFDRFWFLGALCLLYCLYPLINRLYGDLRNFSAVLAVTVVILSLVFISNLTQGLEKHIYQTLRLWNWIFYFMLGGLCKHLTLPRTTAAILVIISAVMNILVIRWLGPYIPTTYCEYFYGCPVVILLSTSVFIFLKGFKIGNSPVIAGLSRLFLPVYAFHDFFFELFEHYGIMTYNGGTLFIAVLLSSIAFSWLIMKIPLLNRFFTLR